MDHSDFFFWNIMIVIGLLSVISQPFPLYTWQVWNTMTALCTLFDSLGKLTLFLLTYAHPGAARGFSIDSCKISWTLNYFKTVERCNCIYCICFCARSWYYRFSRKGHKNSKITLGSNSPPSNYIFNLKKRCSISSKIIFAVLIKTVLI